VSGLEIHFYPDLVYSRLLSPSGRPLRFMRVLKKPITKSTPDHPIKLGKVRLLMARLVGDAFISYYERHVRSGPASSDSFSSDLMKTVLRFRQPRLPGWWMGSKPDPGSDRSVPSAAGYGCRRRGTGSDFLSLRMCIHRLSGTPLRISPFAKIVQ